MACTLVPQIVPEAVTVDVAVAETTLVGVKVAVAGDVAPGLNAMLTPLADPPSTKCESVGVPSENVAGALPTFTKVSVRDSGLPTAVSGKANDVAPPAWKASVAPKGVAESGIVRWLLDGSFVKKFKEPDTGTPAVAELGTATVIVRVPVFPGFSVSDVGFTEKGPPVVVTDMASEPPPWLDTDNDAVLVPPHAVEGKVTVVWENFALALPPSDGSVPASVESWISVMVRSIPPSVVGGARVASSLLQPPPALPSANAIARDAKAASPLSLPLSRRSIWRAPSSLAVNR